MMPATSSIGRLTWPNVGERTASVSPSSETLSTTSSSPPASTT